MTLTFIRYFVILLLFSSNLYAQNFQISGFVVDEKEKGISYANVVLLKSEDNSILTGTTSDENGFYLINNIPEGDYIINVSFIGYQEQNISVTVNNQIEMGVIQLSENTQALEEVNIIVKKPTITKEADRLTFNVANTAIIEGSTLNVLKSTPSLLVMNGQISVKNTITEVYINGRKVHLSNQELIEFLENTPANSISSIEVITNPPASYDASSSNVVNIIMGKNPNPGYRGNVFANYTQGVYPRYNAGTSHYFKGDKTSFNASYSYNQDKFNTENNYLINYRDQNDVLEETWDSDVNRTRWAKTHNGSASFTYNFNDSNSITLAGNAAYTPYYDYVIDNKSDVFNSNGDLDYILNSVNNTDRDKLNTSFDVDYQKQFEDNSQLAINGHYTFYNYDNNQNIVNDYIDPAGTLFNSTSFFTDSNQDTSIFTSSIDYTIKPSEKGQWKAGLKGSNIGTNSAIDRFDYINGSPEYNDAFSNEFNYDETVFAAYANYSREWEKFQLAVGLRGEQTFVKGISENTNNNTDQNYFELFPNISIYYQISENTSVYTNYKRSIERPSYALLNPFQIFLNENTIVTGNPNLKPTFQDKAEVGISFLEYFTVAAYYSRDKGKIYELALQDNQSKSIIYTPLNLGVHRDYGFDFSAMGSLSSRWYLYAVTSFYNAKEEITFDGDNVELDQWSNYSEIVNNWTLLKDNSLNITMSLTYSSKNLMNLSFVDAQLFSNLSISKTILKGKGVLSLSAEDIFNMQDYNWQTRYLNQDSKVYFDQDTRLVKIGFRYKFGNTGLQTTDYSKQSEETERIKDRH